MSQLQWQADLSEWFVEGAWLAAVLLAALYIPNFNWKETLPGKGFFILILAICGALFKNVLMIWGVIHVTEVHEEIQYGLLDEIFTWISIVSLGAAGVAIVLLLTHTVRTLKADSQKKNEDARTPIGKS